MERCRVNGSRRAAIIPFDQFRCSSQKKNSVLGAGWRRGDCKPEGNEGHVGMWGNGCSAKKREVWGAEGERSLTCTAYNVRQREVSSVQARLLLFVWKGKIVACARIVERILLLHAVTPLRKVCV
jgi:hypothetical protein